MSYQNSFSKNSAASPKISKLIFIYLFMKSTLTLTSSGLIGVFKPSIMYTSFKYFLNWLADIPKAERNS